MSKTGLYLFASLMILLMSCNNRQNKLTVEVYETSADGNKLKPLTEFPSGEDVVSIEVVPENKFQAIPEFDESFTEISSPMCCTPSPKNAT